MGTIKHREQISAVRHTEESIQRALWEKKPILTKPQFEMMSLLAYAWESDYLIVSKAGYVYECEIKISHADFLNEAKHKEKKMRLLGGWNATRAEYFDFEFSEQAIDAGWKEPMPKPNYFYYVCPEGVINPEELPPFAGLIYISDDGYFNTTRIPAPKLHGDKHSFTDEFLRDKCYWAMWNWIRRYWRKETKDISANTIAAYERRIDAYALEVSDLKLQIGIKST